MSKNIGCEKAIISLILKNPSTMSIIAPVIHSEKMFKDSSNMIIYRALLNMHEKEVSYDESMSLPMLNMELNTMGLIDFVPKTCLEEITRINVSQDNISTYISPIIDDWKLSQTKEMAENISSAICQSNCSFNDVKRIMSKYTHLDDIGGIDQPQLIQTAIKQQIMNLEQDIISPDDSKKYFGTGFAKLDKVMKFRPQNLYLIGGRPGMGKTTLARNIIWNWTSLFKKRIMFISIEMSKEEIIEGFVCKHIEQSSMEFNSLHETKKIEYLKSFSNYIKSNDMELILDDYSSDLNDIISSITSENKTKKIDAVVIDYLQIIQVDGTSVSSNENTIISFVLKKLKSLAKKLRIPIIILSQLNRELEKRENKRPVMADLRGSGSIEQDATVILFLYRDEVYNKDTIDKNTIEIIVGKNRFGKPNQVIKMRFEGEYGNIEDL